MVEKASDIEPLAASVDDNGDCYFVPHWWPLERPTGAGMMRGVIVGLPIHQQGHIARAALEAAAFQSRGGD